MLLERDASYRRNEKGRLNQHGSVASNINVMATSVSMLQLVSGTTEFPAYFVNSITPNLNVCTCA